MYRFLFLCFFSLTVPVVEAYSQFSIGPHHNYLRFDFNNPEELEGYLTGVTANYQYQCENWMANLQYEGSWNIARICGDPCQESDIQEYLVYLRTGWAFPVWEGLCVEPYIGGAFHVFRNHQDPSHGGLTYRWKTWSLPVGIRAYWCCGDCWTLGLFAEWRPDIYARVKVTGKTFRIEREHAFRVELPLFLCFGGENAYSIQVVPFYDWNQFGKTTESNENDVPFAIPTLIRWEAGLRLLLAYTF